MRVGEHMSKNHGSSGSASTDNSEHSAATRDTTRSPSSSFAFVLGVGEYRRGDVAEHLLDEAPRLERLRC